MLLWGFDMSERDILEATLWDLYKEVYGVRPRHMDMGSMTDEELEAMIDALVPLLPNEEF